MLDTPPPNMEEQDCSRPSNSNSTRPIPPMIRNTFLCRAMNSPAFFAASAPFFALLAAVCAAAFAPSAPRDAR